MATLHLSLKVQWYDMIESASKDEYHEIKPYWTKRLFDEKRQLKPYDNVKFSYGYTKRILEKKVKGIRIGIGNPHGANQLMELYILE